MYRKLSLYMLLYCLWPTVAPWTKHLNKPGIHCGRCNCMECSDCIHNQPSISHYITPLDLLRLIRLTNCSI